MTGKQQNIGLQYGLAAGIAMIGFSVILYLAGAKAFTGGFAFLGYGILVGMSVAAALRKKKLNGGWLEFAESQKLIFSVLVIAMLAQSIFVWILMNWIDTDFRNAVSQITLEKTQELLKKMGATSDQIDTAIEGERQKNEYSLGRTSLGFAFSCILMFIIALIISAFVKKKKPVFPVG